MQISDYYLFKRGKSEVYYYGFRVDGKEIQKSCKTTDERKADAAAAKAWSEARRTGRQGGFNPLLSKASECFAVYKERRMKDRSEKDQRVHDNYC